jgi:elongator complex protein 3
MIKTISEIVQ